MLTKALSILLALSLGAVAYLSWTSSLQKGELEKLRSSERALRSSLDRSTHASRAFKRELQAAKQRELQAAASLERALAASPEWADQPVPQDVQDAR